MPDQALEKSNRIFFPGNPWPQGHIITSLSWEAAFNPKTGFWFSLSLMSADYCAEDRDWREDEPYHNDAWSSVSAWRNYGSCVIEAWWNDCRGFVGFAAGEKFDFASLANRSYHIDPCPRGLWDENAFSLYLMGHDSVADHRIRFGPRQPDNRFSLDWSGKIALTYSIGEDYDYDFQAWFDSVSLSQVFLPAKSESEARTLLQAHFQEPELFDITAVTPHGFSHPWRYAAVLKA